jgi:hypothetical protein
VTNLAPYVVKVCIGMFSLMAGYFFMCAALALISWGGRKLGLLKPDTRRPLYLGRARKYL